MVLGQQCEDQWRRAGGQVVDVTPRQRADDHGEEDWREESGVEVDGKEKGLRYLPVSPPFDKLAVSWAFADRMEVMVMPTANFRLPQSLSITRSW